MIPAPRGKKVIAKVLMSLEDVQAGNKRWYRARAILVSQNLENKWLWSLPHQIIGLSGTHALREYSFVTDVPENAKNIRLSVQC